MMPPMTPSGSRSVMLTYGPGTGIVSPWILVAMPAKYSSASIAVTASIAFESRIGLPALSDPATGQGAAVMINSNQGWPLLEELFRSIEREYGWPTASQATGDTSTAPRLDGLDGTYR